MKKLPTLIATLSLFGSMAFAHSDAYKPEFVDTLVPPMLALQEQLAADDLPAAQKAAGAFLEAMKAAPAEGEAAEEATEFRKPAQEIAEAKDLTAARSAFQSLSREMTSLVKHVGTTGKQDLYVAKCPMAFNNKGGTWLQADKNIRNPYFGSRMLKCGSVQKQVAEAKTAPRKDDAPKESDHSGHHH